jgi:hypothetical protein
MACSHLLERTCWHGAFGMEGAARPWQAAGVGATDVPWLDAATLHVESAWQQASKALQGSLQSMSSACRRASQQHQEEVASMQW